MAQRRGKRMSAATMSQLNERDMVEFCAFARPSKTGKHIYLVRAEPDNVPPNVLKESRAGTILVQYVDMNYPQPLYEYVKPTQLSPAADFVRELSDEQFISILRPLGPVFRTAWQKFLFKVEYGIDYDDHTEFFLEKIMAKRVYKGVTQYLVKWEGYPNKYNSWESEWSFPDKRTIQEFERHEDQPPAKRAKASVTARASHAAAAADDDESSDEEMTRAGVQTNRISSTTAKNTSSSWRHSQPSQKTTHSSLKRVRHHQSARKSTSTGAAASRYTSLLQKTYSAASSGELATQASPDNIAMDVSGGEQPSDDLQVDITEGASPGPATKPHPDSQGGLNSMEGVSSQEMESGADVGHADEEAPNHHSHHHRHYEQGDITSARQGPDQPSEHGSPRAKGSSSSSSSNSKWLRKQNKTSASQYIRDLLTASTQTSEQIMEARRQVLAWSQQLSAPDTTAVPWLPGSPADVPHLLQASQLTADLIGSSETTARERLCNSACILKLFTAGIGYLWRNAQAKKLKKLWKHPQASGAAGMASAVLSQVVEAAKHHARKQGASQPGPNFDALVELCNELFVCCPRDKRSELVDQLADFVESLSRVAVAVVVRAKLRPELAHGLAAEYLEVTCSIPSTLQHLQTDALTIFKFNELYLSIMPSAPSREGLTTHAAALHTLLQHLASVCDDEPARSAKDIEKTLSGWTGAAETFAKLKDGLSKSGQIAFDEHLENLCSSIKDIMRHTQQRMLSELEAAWDDDSDDSGGD